MTKQNINNVKFLKKIVKMKEQEDKGWHPSGETDLTIKKLFGELVTRLGK